MMKQLVFKIQMATTTMQSKANDFSRILFSKEKIG